MGHYLGTSDSEIESKISSLPDHLKEIFEAKIREGLTQRHALFIASSYDWRKNES